MNQRLNAKQKRTDNLEIYVDFMFWKKDESSFSRLMFYTNNLEIGIQIMSKKDSPSINQKISY